MCHISECSLDFFWSGQAGMRAGWVSLLGMLLFKLHIYKEKYWQLAIALPQLPLTSDQGLCKDCRFNKSNLNPSSGTYMFFSVIIIGIIEQLCHVSCRRNVFLLHGTGQICIFTPKLSWVWLLRAGENADTVKTQRVLQSLELGSGSAAWLPLNCSLPLQVVN